MKRGVLFLIVMAFALASLAQDWSKIIVGPDKPSKTELQYLKGVNAPVQTQINGKISNDDKIRITQYYGLDSLYFVGTNLYWHKNGFRFKAAKDSTIIPNWSGLKTGLISAFEFDETGGTSASNSVAGAPVATFVNGTFANTTGKIGKCALLDNTDDYIDLSNNSIYNLTNNFSISIWVNVVNISADRYLFTKGTAVYAARINSTGQYRWLTTTLTPSAANTTGYYPGANQWIHLVFTYASGVLKLYENGALKETLNFTGNIATDTFSLKLGRGTGTQVFNGMIDQTLFYSRVLTLGDVQLLYNSGNGRQVIYF